MRVAIVGCGPKGTYALERLLARAAEGPAGGIEVVAFEPHPFPGAGPAYDPRAGAHLLMNYPAAKIDLTHPSEPRSYVGPSFVEWSGWEPDAYPSRAMVGRYLNGGLLDLLDGASIPVRIEGRRARELRRVDCGWRVGAGGGERGETFDEVLLAIGHQTLPPPALEGVESGSEVALRGFGLTAIDLALELTEGRGGWFVGAPTNGLRYLASGHEPARIRPWSRSGRPMLVKPDLPDAGSALAGEAVAAARRRLAKLPGRVSLQRLVGVEVDLARELLVLAAGLEGAGMVAEEIRSWFERAASGRLSTCAEPSEPIAHSLAVERGAAGPGVEWAIGAAWRESYPAIVARLSHGGLRRRDRLAFRTLAAELERLSFGPPAINAAKLLALAEARILDLSDPLRPADPEDLCVDARIAPPGLHSGQEPMGSLIAAGAIRVPTGLRGIEIDRDARCIGHGGSPTPGLSASGRMTEDWVLGNDSLSRSLHPELDGWARRVCLDASAAERDQSVDLAGAGAGG